MPLAVIEDLAVQLDVAPVRAVDARQAPQRYALAAPGGPQQGQALPAPGGEIHVQQEIPVPLLYPCRQCHGFTAFRSSRFSARSTPAEMARLTATQRKARASSLVRQSW